MMFSNSSIASLKLLSPVERDQIISVEPGIKARLRNAGHILGSSILEFWVGEKEETLKVVFSGDLGKKDQLIVRDPHEFLMLTTFLLNPLTVTGDIAPLRIAKKNFLRP